MVLLDTHALIWWRAKSKRLSARALKEMSRARTLLVSPFSFWELAVLARKRRIQLDREMFQWIEDTFADPRFQLAPFSATAAASAGLLGEAFGGDIADRFIYATARELAVPLITKDDAIRSFARSSGDVKTIW